MSSQGVNVFLQLNLILILLCFSISAIIVALAPFIPRISGQYDHTAAVQSMHVRRTARIGGLAIFGAIVVSIFFAPEPISGPYMYLILATSFLFTAGILEDLGFGVSPLNRLIATCFASLMVMWFWGIWLPRLHILGIDMVMSHWAVGIPVTLLVTSGVANGFNMIDGVNGLSSLTAMSAAIALACIGQKAGYSDIVPLALMLASIVFGFFLLNYPFGLIFLGDGGAYVLGFLLSWFGVLILVKVPEVSPWAIFLTMFWPIADMLLAIYRRAKPNISTTAPDRLHAHQMVMRALEIYFLGRGRRSIANPLTTLILAPFVIVPAFVGVMLWNQPHEAFLATLFLFFLFFGSYMFAIPILRKVKKRAALISHDTR